MNHLPMNTARLPGWMPMALALAIAFFGGTGAFAAAPAHAAVAKKHAPPAPERSSAPRAAAQARGDADAEEGRERFLLLSADGFSITQTAYASARQCDAARKRTLQRNPRLARYVAQGEVDFECVADDAGADLPYQASIVEKSTGLRADLSMRTQAQCEIGMRNAKAAARRYTILSMCHARPWGQAMTNEGDAHHAAGPAKA